MPVTGVTQEPGLRKLPGTFVPSFRSWTRSPIISETVPSRRGPIRISFDCWDKEEMRWYFWCLRWRDCKPAVPSEGSYTRTHSTHSAFPQTSLCKVTDQELCRHLVTEKGHFVGECDPPRGRKTERWRGRIMTWGQNYTPFPTESPVGKSKCP